MTRRILFAIPAALMAQAADYRGWKVKFDPKRDSAADLEGAKAEAKRDGKKILLDIGGEWCGWCHRMDQFLDENPDLAAKAKRSFVWLKINVSEENRNKAFLERFSKVSAYPHLFVLDAEGKELHSQDTGVLEKGKGYDKEKWREFLEKWGI